MAIKLALLKSGEQVIADIMTVSIKLGCKPVLATAPNK